MDLSATLRIIIINGPNLNMLGVREPEIYGHKSLEEIQASCVQHAATLGVNIDFRQSNSEAEIIDWIHGARDTAGGIVINPAAFTHTSIAILDALAVTGLPIVEIHISNIFKRESFRQHSYISAGATGIISGFGARGYLLAIDAMVGLISPEKGV
ncbi:MAG: type II 3-dehydroquinate dehydratase [Pseudomonadota bacterium]|nr:type II 3-dehydroquinate dehydratase [Pseudomonadota bacterium]